MKRSYFSAPVNDFLLHSRESIFGQLAISHHFPLEEPEKRAWQWQIDFLQSQLRCLNRGYIIFEYSIPRMGKRVDAVLIVDGYIIIIEFKVGASEYQSSAIHQVLDYALDLKNFHNESRHLPIIPLLVASQAPNRSHAIAWYEDNVAEPLLANQETFVTALQAVNLCSPDCGINPIVWESSEYRPTPTIVEAAQALYRGHGVEDISRSDAANISLTTGYIADIIDQAKTTSTKAICFVTGVPGAGKTLAGLNLACECQRIHNGEHAVFLSGNGPLVQVLQEALARYEVQASDVMLRKNTALSRTKAFIQNIHHFRDDAVMSPMPPVDKVAVFDEAQRAWDCGQTERFMSQKKGIPSFRKSEPEYLIEIMDRHKEWAVIICLIGGGQEINTGEAGLPEWFRALGTRFRHWDVYVSDHLEDYEYNRNSDLYTAIASAKLKTDPRLHLSTSIRSFRSEKLAAYIKAILDLDVRSSRETKRALDGKYPIVLTRDLKSAKAWIRNKARGTERYGLIASSGAHRLRPFGISVKVAIDPVNWFLNDQFDVRSSYYLEEVATEFDIQGLELDWALLAWDADLRIIGDSWKYMSFRGTIWQEIRDQTRQMYLKNAYRVLLTRARQGMVIFIPDGDYNDRTRLPEYYDGIYHYLRKCGIEEVV